MFEPSLVMLDRVVFLIVGLFGLISCFFGHRLLRIWLTLAGAQTGFYLGLRFGGLLLPDPVHHLVLAVLAAVILGGFFCIFSRIGAMLAGAGVMALLTDSLLRLISVKLPANIQICLFAGLMLLGVLLGVLKLRPFLILASAWNGGWLAAFCTGGVLAAWPPDSVATRYDSLSGGSLALVLIGAGVLLILGAAAQFRLPRKKTGAAAQAAAPVIADEPAVSGLSTGLVLPEMPAASEGDTSADAVKSDESDAIETQ